MKLQGLFSVTVTADWRFVMPKPWRCAFNTAIRPTALVTRRDPECWRIYPGDDIRVLFEGHAALSMAHPDQHAALRMIGASRVVELDWHGTLAVEDDLRDWVRVDAPFAAVLIGMGDYLELWPDAAWRAAQADFLSGVALPAGI